MAGSTVNSVITVSACPAIAVPCGFDQYGRPVGLQLVGKPRGEAALLQAASLYEKLVGLHKLLPIDPKPGTVPPSYVGKDLPPDWKFDRDEANAR